MSYIPTKHRFHCAVDGVGLILQGAPERPGYRQGQAPVYGQRFASGDRTYNDLSQWWYFAQTDWSGGIKDDPSWEDDGKFYYSTNIDTWSEPGAIKLCRNPQTDETFTEDIICSISGEVNGSQYNFVGTADGSGSRPLLYQASTGIGQTWTEVAGTTFATGRDYVSSLLIKAGILWVGTVGSTSDSNDIVNTYNGSAFTDQSTYITSVLSFTPTASRTSCQYQGTHYIFVDDDLGERWGLVKTTVTNPSANSDYSLVFQRTSDTGIPVSSYVFQGNIYYLVRYVGYMELRMYSISGTVDTLLKTFRGASPSLYGVSDKYFSEVNGKLVITIPPEEIWETDGDVLERIFVRDPYKRDNLAAAEAGCYLTAGAIVNDNKAWWGNLMYDGVHFYNTFKGNGDSTTATVTMLFSDTENRMWLTDSSNIKKLYYYPLSSDGGGQTFKSGGANKNFLVFSNHDKVSGVEKLLYSVLPIFKTLASGNLVNVRYTTGDLTGSTSWTDLSSAQFSVEGAITDKPMFLPVGTTFKKVWYRVGLNTGSNVATTPTLTDFVSEYLPYPSYKKLWSLRVNAADEVKRLDGSLVETTGRELKSLLEMSWWKKSVVDFQDLDYATDQLNGAINSTTTTLTLDSTEDFPEQGRVRVEDEEIFYTGKTPTTLTGCTRGARGSRAVEHSDDTVVNNAYKVLVTELQDVAPAINEGKFLEYVVEMNLREV